MKIMVCVKQVPSTTQVEVDPETGVLRRDGVASKLNPYDLFAIEAALRLAQDTNGEVSVLSMGPPQAKQVLLEAIAIGAKSGVLVSDKRFAGADVLATAYTLSQAVRQGKVPDIVLCGKQTTDGDTAQVGAEMAEFLGWPHANNVQSIEIDKDHTVKVRYNMDTHIVTQQMPIPCVLCVDSEINTPRLPSYRRKKCSSENSISTINLEHFEDKDASHYGLSGSPTQVERIFTPQKNDEKEMLQGTTTEKAARLLAILRQRKLI